MTFDFGMVKKHPLAIGGSIAVLGTIVFYLIVKRSSSGGSSDVTTASSQFLQAQAAANMAAAGYNAQLVEAQLQAGVQSQAIAEQASSYSKYLDTQQTVQLGTAQIASTTTLGLSEMQTDVQKAAIKAQSDFQQGLQNIALNGKFCDTKGNCRSWKAANLNEIISALLGKGPNFTAAEGNSGFSINTPYGGFGVNLGK